VTTPQAQASAVVALVEAEAAPALTAAPSVVSWLHRLCRAAVRALPASGAGISLITEAGVGAVTTASDDVSRSLEELQFTLGAGPCLEAFSSRIPVLEPDLSARSLDRWPAYAVAAHALGVRAVFAFPLQVGAARLGALDIYRIETGSLSQQALAQALTFADVALDALLDAQASSGPGHVPDGVERSLDSHYVVYQAQGMVMVDLSISLSEAMTRLRAHAFSHDCPLNVVAADIVAGRLRLDRDVRSPMPPSDPLR